jgi:hypothetical protein
MSETSPSYTLQYMQLPAPQKQKIAGRSDSSEDTKEEEAFNTIENIEAVTEEDKKKIDNDISSDSSDSTITEVKEDYKWFY